MYRDTIFDNIDVLRAVILLGEYPQSRQELTEKLGLGEGSVRTILDLLKQKGLIESSQKGHYLAKKGIGLKTQLNAIMQGPKLIEMKNIYPKYKKVSLLLRKHDKKEINYQIRDVALKAGAEGALILQYTDKLILPGVYMKISFSEIEKEYVLKKDDIVVATLSNNVQIAEKAALAVALHLSSPLAKLAGGIVN